MTPAQKRALEVIEKDYSHRDFASPYDPVTGRDISKATLRKLRELGHIEIVKVNESKYYTRERFGRGNYYQHKSVEIVYRYVGND